jgi:pimeloyl-ACP methyl ester carboxylesterase
VPVVGFSLGGWTGVELAILRPQLVKKLVMVAAAGVRVPQAPMGELFIDNLDKLRQLLFFDQNDPSIPLAMPTSLDDPRILMWLRAREATARIAWNPYLHNPRLAAHLRRVECPTLVMWGRHDKLLPLGMGEYFAQHIPGARLEVMENCGHMLPFEKPAEFAAASVKFLRG